MSSYHRNYRDSLIFDQIKLSDTMVPNESLLSTPKLFSDETYNVEPSTVDESPSSIKCTSSIDSNLSSPEILRKDSGTSIDYSSPEPLIRRVFRANALRDKQVLCSPNMDYIKYVTESPNYDADVSTSGSHKKRVVTSSVIVGKDADINFDMSSIQFDEENSSLNRPMSRFVDSNELTSPILGEKEESDRSMVEASPRDEIFTKQLSPLPETIPSANQKLVGLHDSAPEKIDKISKISFCENSFNSIPLTAKNHDLLNTPKANPSKHRHYLATTFPYLTELLNHSCPREETDNCTVIGSSLHKERIGDVKFDDLSRIIYQKSFSHWHKVIENMVLSSTFQANCNDKNVSTCDSFTQTIPTEVYAKQTLLNQQILTVEEEESLLMEKLLVKLLTSGYHLKKNEM